LTGFFWANSLRFVDHKEVSAREQNAYRYAKG